MKISIHENASLAETEIIINCRTADASIFDMLALLRSFDRKLTGERDGETFLLEPCDVYYIDTVDKRTFLYTANAVYETPLRLYQLEDALAGGSFFRASKSTIINIAKIQSLRPDLSGRLSVTLQNGERLSVSRQYVPTLRQLLGMR